MRLKPTYPYCGLTVILSNPSRFDLELAKKNNKHELITANGGNFFQQDCLRQTSRLACDIRTADTQHEGFLEGTKGLLLLGDTAFQQYSVGYTDYTLGEQRGCLLDNPWNLPAIASYLPQDAVDIVDWEGKHNPLLQDDDHESERDDEEEGDGKSKGKTRRSNWRFWLEQDVTKILSIVSRGIPKEPEPNYQTYPSSEHIVDYLWELNGADLYFDIETDPPSFNTSVFSVGHSLAAPIFIVPCIRFLDYSCAYSPLQMCKIWRALGRAFSRNRVVIHNSMFDLIVMAMQYKLDLPLQIYDTMLAFHRLYPEAEKSLGHVMSWGTYQRYHKDEGIFKPRTIAQEQTLWRYNGKDVFGIMLAKQAIERYAENDLGLRSSIAEANRRPRSYLVNTLQGIHYEEAKRKEMMRENDRKMMQFLRILKLLVGYDFLPSSNKQCIEYFHNRMGYKVIKFSKKTQKPSLDGDALYRLKLKNPDNPVIDFCIAYRERQKETSTLKWTPWIPVANE